MRWLQYLYSCQDASALAQVKDQARRLSQLEDMLREAQLHPVACRWCNDGDAPASADVERQLSSATQELQVCSM